MFSAPQIFHGIATATSKQSLGQCKLAESSHFVVYNIVCWTDNTYFYFYFLSRPKFETWQLLPPKMRRFADERVVSTLYVIWDPYISPLSSHWCNNIRRKPNPPVRLVFLHGKSSRYCIKTLAILHIVSRSQPNRMKIVVPSLYGLISIALPKPDLSISTQRTWKSHGNRVALGHMFKQSSSSNACYGL